jgi:hypothetical protein
MQPAPHHRLQASSAALLMLCLAFASCGRNQTAKLLQGKKWEVYDVTPPGGTFSIEASNRAQELKDGFYKNAWFRFLPDGIFIASFHGRSDSGKYRISAGGKTISLYPEHGSRMYEQMQIRQLTQDRFSFNTVIADFHMVLHLKAAESGSGKHTQ